MRCITIIRALLVRLLFAGHGLIAIWRLFMVIREIWCWYLTAAIGGLFLETMVTLCKKKGKEWKWFCPSVFFYLASVVPAIWFLELSEMEDRIAFQEEKKRALNRTLTNQSITEDVIHYDFHSNKTEEDLSMNIKELGWEITIPLALTSDLWLRVLEQFLLLMLIIGRWMLPKGALSHDQLSQLLLVYVGTAADIVEFYEAFNEEGVKYNRLLCYIILGIWTMSLLQFTLVLTATRARQDRTGVPSYVEPEDVNVCCKPEIYGILTSIMLQDCPFLVVRLLLIFKYKVISYTNMFFTSKNSLVIILLLYRLIVIQSEARRKKRNINSSSNSSLVQLRVPNDYGGNGKTYTCLGGNLNLKPSSSAPNVCKQTMNSSMDSLPRYKVTTTGSLPRYEHVATKDRRSDPVMHATTRVRH